MKNIVIFALLIALVLSLVSCGTDVAESTEDRQEPSDTETESPTEIPDEYSALTGVKPTDEEGIYAIEFYNGTKVLFDSSAAEKAYGEAQTKGYTGTLIQFLAFSVMDVKNAFYVGGNMGAVTFGTVLAKMLESYPEYFLMTESIKGYETAVTVNEGFVSEKGETRKNSSTQTYRYTQRIRVAEGQVFELICGGQKVPMRYVTAYKNGAASEKDSVTDSVCKTTSYEVPKGVTELVATFKATEGEIIARISGDSKVAPALGAWVDRDALAELMGEYTPPTPLLQMTQALLKDDVISLGENHVMNSKLLTLTFELDGLEEGEIISFGHGESDPGGSVVELTNTHIRAYYRNSNTEEHVNTAHGLDISGAVKITVKAGYGTATVSIEVGEDRFVTGAFKWGGRNGSIYVRSVGVALKDLSLSWGCSDFDKEIWLFGDSYFNMTDRSRWPSYMLKEGYTDYLMSGYPGRKSAAALDDFQTLLEFGTPKYAVWCMGMNDSDSASAANAAWREATEAFLAICEEKEITPILTTIPNTPSVTNLFKNEIVRASGHRYIDFATAVDANKKGSPWTADMLSTDGVHPAPTGAKALWEQVKKDFPEILK